MRHGEPSFRLAGNFQRANLLAACRSIGVLSSAPESLPFFVASVSLILSARCVDATTRTVLVIELLSVVVGDRWQMLKVTVVDGRAEARLLVEGKLTAPWVSELESAWKQTRQSCRSGRIAIDLSGTTVIDSSGKAALMGMIGEGARLVAKGVYTEYLVRGLMNQARQARVARRRQNGANIRDSSSTRLSSQASQGSPHKERY